MPLPARKIWITILQVLHFLGSLFKNKNKNPYIYYHNLHGSTTTTTEFQGVHESPGSIGYVVIKQLAYDSSGCSYHRIELPVDLVKKLEEYIEKFKPT